MNSNAHHQALLSQPCCPLPKASQQYEGARPELSLDPEENSSAAGFNFSAYASPILERFVERRVRAEKVRRQAPRLDWERCTASNITDEITSAQPVINHRSPFGTQIPSGLLDRCPQSANVCPASRLCLQEQRGLTGPWPKLKEVDEQHALASLSLRPALGVRRKMTSDDHSALQTSAKQLKSRTIDIRGQAPDNYFSPDPGHSELHGLRMEQESPLWGASFEKKRVRKQQLKDQVSSSDNTPMSDDGDEEEEDKWLKSMFEEHRLEKLGQNCKTTISQRDLLKLAPRFSKNIVIHTQSQPKKPEISTRRRKHKYRYYNIYKNMMRDVKAYFKDKFVEKLQAHDREVFLENRIRKNFYLTKVMQPVHLLKFALEIFDPELVNFFASSRLEPGKTLAESMSRGREAALGEAYKALAFKIGALMNPKLMVQCSELDAIVNKNLKVDVEWVLNYLNTQSQGRLGPLVGGSADRDSLSWEQATSKDFFGLWKGKTPAQIKIKTLDQYRYIFRFSVERLANMVEDEFIMMILLQYLADTKFQRIHHRPQMAVNGAAYYRALENLINASQHKATISNALSNLKMFQKTRAANQQKQPDRAFKLGSSSPGSRNEATFSQPRLPLGPAESAEEEEISFEGLLLANMEELE